VTEGGHLRAVSEQEEATGSEVRRGEEPRRRGLTRYLIIAGLVIGFFALAMGWFSAHQRSLALEAKLSAVSGQLEAAEGALLQTRDALDARRSHFERVRDGVDAMAAELRALTAILEEDPEATPTSER
jgi:hypothetical protein